MTFGLSGSRSMLEIAELPPGRSGISTRSLSSMATVLPAASDSYWIRIARVSFSPTTSVPS